MFFVCGSQDFLRHIFSVSIRERVERTMHALEKFSLAEEGDRLGFASGAWDVRHHSCVYPLVYASAYCAPEMKDSRFRLRHETDRVFELKDKQKEIDQVQRIRTRAVWKRARSELSVRRAISARALITNPLLVI